MLLLETSSCFVNLSSGINILPKEILPNMLQPFYYICKRSSRILGSISEINLKMKGKFNSHRERDKNIQKKVFCQCLGSGRALKIHFWMILSQMPVPLMDSTTDLYFLCKIKEAIQIEYTLGNAIDFSL